MCDKESIKDNIAGSFLHNCHQKTFFHILKIEKWRAGNAIDLDELKLL